MLEKQFYLYFIFQHFSSKAPHIRPNHLEAMRNHVLWLFKPASYFLPDTLRLRDVLNWSCTSKFISLSGNEIANKGKHKRRAWFSDKLSKSNTRGSSSSHSVASDVHPMMCIRVVFRRSPVSRAPLGWSSFFSRSPLHRVSANTTVLVTSHNPPGKYIKTASSSPALRQQTVHNTLQNNGRVPNQIPLRLIKNTKKTGCRITFQYVPLILQRQAAESNSNASH